MDRNDISLNFTPPSVLCARAEAERNAEAEYENRLHVVSSTPAPQPATQVALANPVRSFQVSEEQTADIKKPLQFKPLAFAKTRVLGQERATLSIDSLLSMACSGLIGGNGKPLASFLLLGPSGVGKTETAKAIAEVIYGDKNRVARFNMNEAQGEGGNWRAFGPPRGYMGSDKGGVLTEQIKKFEGRCVILLDEMEKGPREIFDALMTGLDEGYVEDSSFGTRIDISEAIIVMTSNALANNEEMLEADEDELRHELTEYEADDRRSGTIRPFRPEFVGRIQKVLFYKRLDAHALKHIVRQRYENEYATRIARAKGVSIESLTDEMASYIVSKATSDQFGVRKIDRIIEEQLLSKIVNVELPQGISLTWHYDISSTSIQLLPVK